MAPPIWPITLMAFPMDHQLLVDGVINSFGDGFEQRIVTGLPRLRADGEGGVSTYIGRNVFTVGVPRLQWLTNPIPGNANLDNSTKVLWNFYKDRFYNPSTNVPQWEAFYWYNPVENDDFSTWTGDTPNTGTNGRGEAVSEATGRYLVRFQTGLTRTQFIYCLFRFEIELEEVAA